MSFKNFGKWKLQKLSIFPQTASEKGRESLFWRVYIWSEVNRHNETSLEDTHYCMVPPGPASIHLHYPQAKKLSKTQRKQRDWHLSFVLLCKKVPPQEKYQRQEVWIYPCLVRSLSYWEIKGTFTLCVWVCDFSYNKKWVVKDSMQVSHCVIATTATVPIQSIRSKNK